MYVPEKKRLKTKNDETRNSQSNVCKKKNLTLTKENLDWVVTTGYTIVSQTFLLKSKQ